MFYSEELEDNSPVIQGPLESFIAALPGYEDILKTLGFYQFQEYEG